MECYGESNAYDEISSLDWKSSGEGDLQVAGMVRRSWLALGESTDAYNELASVS